MQKFLSLIFIASISLMLNAQGTAKRGTDKIFEENLGQWDEKIKFKASMLGVHVFYEAQAIHYQLSDRSDEHLHEIDPNEVIHGHVYKTKYVNSRSKSTIVKEDASSAYYNYFIGSNRSKWASGVRKYGLIRYKNLYKGIDAVHYRANDRLKIDYIISPGTDPDKLKMQYEGVDNVSITDNRLIVSHSLGNTTEEKPFAYQMINGEKLKVPCQYIQLENGSISFAFPEGYDKNKELIIDPELIFSTYSGSVSNNFGMSGTYDNLGNGYMGGLVYGSSYIAQTGAYQTTFGHGQGDFPSSADIGIAKIAANGINLLYATFLGGNGNETIHSMVVDDNNDLYIMGASSSSNYPTSIGAYDSIKTAVSGESFSTDIFLPFNGGTDIVVSKLSADGTSLLGSTFYGGIGIDGLNVGPSYQNLNYNYGDYHRGEIVVDSSGFCYIGTVTRSNDLDTTLSQYQGGQDGLIVKFSSNLDSMVWSRYLGGRNIDAVNSLKIINNNKVLVGGGTTSFDDFPTTPNAYKSTSSRGRADGFITIISNDGDTIEKSTFIGTNSYDQVYFIEFDRFNGVYAYGQTNNTSFPIKNAPRANIGAGQFIVKLDQNLDSLIYSTTFGAGAAGTINLSPTAFLVDQCQNVYASGWGGNLSSVNNSPRKTLPANMPLANNDSEYGTTDGNDFYLYVLNREIDSVLYASYFGGDASEDHVDGGTSRFDKKGIIYQSVCASCGLANDDFPIKNAYSDTDQHGNGMGAGCNNALFKFDFEVLPKAEVKSSRLEGCAPFAATIFNESKNATELIWDFNGSIVTNLKTDTNVLFRNPGRYVIRQIARDTICNSSDRDSVIIIVRPNIVDLNLPRDTTICDSVDFTMTAITNGTADDFIWSTNRLFSDTLNILGDSSLTITPYLEAGTYYIRASESVPNPCIKVDSVIVRSSIIKVDAALTADTVCQGAIVQLNSDLESINKFVWDLGDGRLDSVNLNPRVVYSNVGIYNIRLLGRNSVCNKTDSAQLRVEIVGNQLQLIELPDTFSCLEDTIRLMQNSLGTADAFIWSSSSTYSDTLNAFPLDSVLEISSSNISQYFIQIEDRFCVKKDTINYENVIYELDFEDLIDSACSPYQQELNTTLIGLDSFRINLGNGSFTNTDQTPTIIFNDEGIYTIELIGSNAQCQFIDTLSQNVHVFQDVNLQPLIDTTICLGDEIGIAVNSNGTAQFFSWDLAKSFENPLNSPLDSGIQIRPTGTTTYYVRGENVICRAIDSMEVVTELVEVQVEDILSICLEDSIEIEADVISFINPLSFRWEPNDSIISGQGSRNITVSPKVNALYYLFTTSSIGCEDFDSVEVEVNVPVFTTAEIFSKRDSIFKGEQTRLSTNRNGSNLLYLWEPPQGFDNTNSPSPLLTVNQTQDYKVTITDISTGCIVEALRRITVFEVNCNEPDIYIPNAFTPNTDGNNDILLVRGANLRSIEFQLFNRWGELVFETTDKNSGWDGTYKGKKVQPGVFAYQLRALCFDGQEYYTKGNITLIR